jgi:hypothetical protein
MIVVTPWQINLALPGSRYATDSDFPVVTLLAIRGWLRCRQSKWIYRVSRWLPRGRDIAGSNRCP